MKKEEHGIGGSGISAWIVILNELENVFGDLVLR
jgi:hypothetical protein